MRCEGPSVVQQLASSGNRLGVGEPQVVGDWVDAG
jgi:hypothetical protein